MVISVVSVSINSHSSLKYPIRYQFKWFISDNNDLKFKAKTHHVLSIHKLNYRISSDIRQTFFSFQNNPKDLDPSYKTDLDL